MAQRILDNIMKPVVPELILVPFRVLKAAVNPEAGHVVHAYNGPRGSESTDCTGCGRRNSDGWGEPVEHKDDCSYVAQQEALTVLRQIVAEAEGTK